MFCPKCGNIVNDGAKFCTSCGAKLSNTSTVNQDCRDHTHPGEVSPSLDVISAVKLSMSRLTDFRGRSRRSEYWWTMLVVGLVAGLLTAIWSDAESVLSLITFLLGLAVTIRRLHDIGKSGWWYLINLVPVVGSIVLLIFLVRDSAPANRFGPSPKA